MSAPLRRVERQISSVDRATKLYQSANDKLSASQQLVSRTTAGASSSFKGFASSVSSAVTGVVSSAGKASTAIVGIGTAAASIAVGTGLYKTSKAALKLASDAEMAQIAFETMLGDPQKSQKFLLDLKNYAADSPFDLQGLRTSSRQMLGFGFAAESVIPMLRNFSDASAGLGLGTDGIKRMTVAFGQMKAKGKIQGDEILQLAEMGIPSVQILADKMKITQAATLDLVSKGLVPADKAIKVILDGLDKRYGGLSEKQAKTLSGMYNKLKDTFENDLLVKWGEGISKALAPRFKQLTTWIDKNQDKITKWGDSIGRAASYASDAIIRKVEKAFNYVKKNFFDNPDFAKAETLGEKFRFVIESFKDTFDEWYNNGGKTQIDDTVKTLVGYVSSAVKASYTPFKQIGMDIGRPLADGMLDGMKAFAKENPEAASLVALLVTPGGARLKLAAALFTGTQGYLDKYLGSPTTDTRDDGSKRFYYKDGKLMEVPWFNSMYNAFAEMSKSITPDKLGLKTSDQFFDNLKSTSNGVMSNVWDGAPKKATGISEVPYNGMPAILHRGEAVL
ncbi:tape measure protein, partial [Paenibacillus vulneris]